MSAPRFWWPTRSGNLQGNAFGYSRAAAAMRAGLLMAGAIEDYDAKVAIHFVYPRNYEPMPGRYNAIFTMFENAMVPPWFKWAFDRCDAILVPAPYCEEIFRPYTDKPIHYVPLGMNPELWPYVPREDPAKSGRPFRFLWAGAHNLRKGWREVLDAWEGGGFDGDPKVELYLKYQDGDDWTGRRRNLILDPRVVDDQEMLRIYAAADAFVFPSYGEGFGLTLLEAMATGLPCIAPLHTGLTAFADNTTVIPVKYEPVMMQLEEFDRAPGGMAPGLSKPWPAPCLRARVPHLIRRMRSVLYTWEQSRALGMRAHERAQHFTWERAGVKLRQILGAIEAGTMEGAQHGDPQ